MSVPNLHAAREAVGTGKINFFVEIMANSNGVIKVSPSEAIRADFRPKSIEPRAELTYLRLRGRAELARLAFAAAGKDYTDVRIAGEELEMRRRKRGGGYRLPRLRWTELDANTRTEVEEEVSGAIPVARFLAKRLGLDGHNDLERSLTDTLVDYMGKYHEQLDAIFEAECPDDRQIVVDYFIDEFLPQFLDTLEELLKSNDGHFLAGDNPTIADLAVMDLLQMIEDPDDNLYSGLDRCDARFLLLRHFPLLSEHAALTAQALKGVAAWLEQRPEDARVVEKVLLVTKTWETVYSIKHRREDE